MSGIRQLDQFDFHATLAATPGPSLVLFSAPACGACRHWRRLLTAYRGTPGLQIFEVDVARDQALAREFEVFHLPALFLFRDGDYHAPLQSEAHPARLAAAVAAALAAPAEEAP